MAGRQRKGAGSEAGLHVTQTRSEIGTKPKHRGTLRALGLRRIGQSNVLPDRPEIRGMLARVPHLVSVTAIDAPQAVAPSKSRAKAAADENDAVEVKP
jgi:large subunit ribosomal protein L30